MPAQPIVTFDDIVENMIFQCEVDVTFFSLAVALEAYRAANSTALNVDVSQDTKNECLKKYTGCVVSTGTDLNCYPLGDDTTKCFDLSGNPVP